METGRTILLSCGRSPRARLPLFFLINFSLAVASGLLSAAGCSVRESLPSDPPAGLAHDAVQDGRGIPGVETELRLHIRPCRGAEETPDGDATRADDWHLIRRLDLFIFEDDGIGMLDAYSRSYAYSPTAVELCSSGGEKRVVAVANAAFPDSFVSSILSYEDLRGAVVSLTEDNPSYPIMSGEARFTAGSGRSCDLTLEPMMSVIELRSLRFRGAGEALTGVRVYLTGIGNRAELLREEGFLPSETLNNGGLSETDLARLAYSGMVYRYLGNGRPDGDGTAYGTASLYCYPNEAEEESAGSPFTRLVIEGKLNGQTCYYPIPIDRDLDGGNGAGGIGRNRRYVYEILLTRAGTGSPDDIRLFHP